MIGSNYYSVKRFSIITTSTSTSTSTTIRRRRINLLDFVKLLLLLQGIISSFIPTMAYSTSSRVFAFTLRNHGTGSSSTYAHRMMVPVLRTTSHYSYYSGLSTSSSVSLLSSINSNPSNESDYASSERTTTTTTTGPRTNNGKFTTIPRRTNNNNNNSNKFFPNKINNRAYSTNGRINTDSINNMRSSSFPQQQQQQQQSFSTSSFEDDDLDAALDNVLTSSTASKSTPDGSYNPVCFFSHDFPFLNLGTFFCVSLRGDIYLHM